MDVSDDRLDLLLADGDKGRPALEDGLEGEAAQRGKKPKKPIPGSGDGANDWRRSDADPNDLRLQRWGVVAPKGRSGDRLLEAMTPLLRLREEEQGALVKPYRVPPDMDVQQSVDWKNDVYESEEVHEDNRPLYLLMLGAPDQISLELQHTLTNGSRVGRVHFADAAGEPDLDAYAGYADKVVRFARRGTPEASPDMLFFVARDGTKATIAGSSKLVGPSLAAAKRSVDEGLRTA
jgi:hypothetical protein